MDYFAQSEEQTLHIRIGFRIELFARHFPVLLRFLSPKFTQYILISHVKSKRNQYQGHEHFLHFLGPNSRLFYEAYMTPRDLRCFICPHLPSPVTGTDECSRKILIILSCGRLCRSISISKVRTVHSFSWFVMGASAHATGSPRLGPLPSQQPKGSTSR